jgi:hypothetical protein
VSGYALATRLSYFLWETTPDDQLLADAGKGSLATPEGIQTEVTRMMADARFADTLASFHDQWLGLQGVVGATKTSATTGAVTPPWNTTLQGELLREADLFIKDVYETGGSLGTLLTSTKAFVNKDLGQFYGLASGAGADAATYAPVATLPNRHGVLTLPAVLAGLAHADQSAPVKRGKMIREQILCSAIPDPPNNLVITIPKVAPGPRRASGSRCTAPRPAAPFATTSWTRWRCRSSTTTSWAVTARWTAGSPSTARVS